MSLCGIRGAVCVCVCGTHARSHRSTNDMLASSATATAPHNDSLGARIHRPADRLKADESLLPAVHGVGCQGWVHREGPAAARADDSIAWREWAAKKRPEHGR